MATSTIKQKVNIGNNINIASTTLTSGAFKTLATITVSKIGVYIIETTVSFSAGNGVRVLLVDTTQTDINNAENSVLNEGRATLQKVRFFRLSPSDTIYIRGYQNSGSNMDVIGDYRILQIS